MEEKEHSADGGVGHLWGRGLCRFTFCGEPIPLSLPLIVTNTTLQLFPFENCCSSAIYETVSFTQTKAFKKQLPMNYFILELMAQLVDFSSDIVCGSVL